MFNASKQCIKIAFNILSLLKIKIQYNYIVGQKMPNKV